jgi:hypothetical protein
MGIKIQMRWCRYRVNGNKDPDVERHGIVNGNKTQDDDGSGNVNDNNNVDVGCSYNSEDGSAPQPSTTSLLPPRLIPYNSLFHHFQRVCTTSTSTFPRVQNAHVYIISSHRKPPNHTPEQKNVDESLKRMITMNTLNMQLKILKSHI